ncbi:hypothetical protein DITRI_Ditri07aG0060100 [Diplodiscus trichospermus]
MDDESIWGLFWPIMKKVLEVHHPDAVVLQCGADYLLLTEGILSAILPNVGAMRNTILEQLSKVSHAPSTTLQTTTTTTIHHLSHRGEDDTDERSKSHIRNGDDYVSDPEDEVVLLRRFSNSDVKQLAADAEMM